MFVKPAQPGAIVRFPRPSRRVLDQAGEDVPDTRWWHRRLAHGDVVAAKTPVAAPVSPPAPPPAAPPSPPAN